jgi:hypothetical protein
MQYWIAWKNRPLPFCLLPPMKVQDPYMWASSFLCEQPFFVILGTNKINL